MAEAVGLAASLISLTALFSTCIECFDYYRAARDCPREVRTKLVKLDFEKTRLLIWANKTGLVSTDASSRNPAIERYQEDLRATLQQIHLLLTDANKMSGQYGIRQQDYPALSAETATDLVSRNSLDIFLTSYRRFRGKFLSPKNGPNLSARFRWAVTDEAKFEGLIRTLKDFVDNLFWLVEVDRSVQDHIVEEDILAVTNLVDLEIIRDASENEYQVWSDTASRAVDRTERGTIHDNDQNGQHAQNEPFFATTEISREPTARATSEVFDQAREWKSYIPPACFVLTDLCTSFSTPHPCQDDDFNTNFWYKSAREYSHQEFADIYPHPGDRLAQQYRIGSWTRKQCVDNALKMGLNFTAGQRLRPKVFIYIAPCERLISQAIALILESRWAVGKTFLHLIRVDDRLPVSCCKDGTGLIRIASILRQLSDSTLAPSSNLSFLDRMWLEQRIYDTDVEERQNESIAEPSDNFIRCYREDIYSPNEIVAAIIQVGEEDQLRELMSLKPFPRHPHVPAATEMYAIHTGHDRHFQRRFLGTYLRNKRFEWKDSDSTGSAANKRLPTDSATSSPSLSSEEASSKPRKILAEASVGDEDQVEVPQTSADSELPVAMNGSTDESDRLT